MNVIVGYHHPVHGLLEPRLLDIEAIPDWIIGRTLEMTAMQHADTMLDGHRVCVGELDLRVEVSASIDRMLCREAGYARAVDFKTNWQPL